MTCLAHLANHLCGPAPSPISTGRWRSGVRRRAGSRNPASAGSEARSFQSRLIDPIRFPRAVIATWGMVPPRALFLLRRFVFGVELLRFTIRQSGPRRTAENGRPRPRKPDRSRSPHRFARLFLNEVLRVPFKQSCCSNKSRTSGSVISHPLFLKCGRVQQVHRLVNREVVDRKQVFLHPDRITDQQDPCTASERHNRPRPVESSPKPKRISPS